MEIRAKSSIIVQPLGRNLEPTVCIENTQSVPQGGTRSVCNILVGRNYVSYALSDPECSLVRLLKHYYFKDRIIGKRDFQEILSDPALQGLEQVKIAIDSVKSVLIPDPLYRDADRSRYFEFLHDLSPDEALFVQKLNGNKTSVYSLKKSTVAFLETLFPEISFYDATSSLLNTYPSLLFNDDMHTIFLNCKDDCASVSVYYKKELRFHHVYADVSNVDLQYYLAAYLHEQNLDVEKVLILLLGEGSRLPEIQSELSKYYSHIKYCSRIQHLQYPETLYAHPVHAFFNLFSLVTCA